ncbi:phosphoglycerate mutase, putative [Talaromyces stipitatus ATCC 10500]|uniref:Phosphoglycerate mutase, putative n=1 Tax=Talaromyces stipitatus (strain ATCC 10500 / CBS 375.48 / QM 6759 / NRRL 1006) TaxID=441959 RepID=B8M221_TALSN|nr:phosphoglycerate mutase, putative [Talaromyces stipitatus ATCC 10500]EED21485.1 phosphoglycerate mutase, putative [Talaromyces stipitatus ATCC 10500]
MAPRVHCVRHAQGEHNKGGDAYLIPDPRLTEAGIKECQDLEARFPYQSSIDLIVSSPLRRTLQTALYSFQPAIKRGVRVVAVAELQETSDVACDTGSDVADLKREFAERRLVPMPSSLDLSQVPENWNKKTGKWAPSSDALISRARAARQWLMQRPEKEVVVVCHGGFLHYFTQDWSGIKAEEHASAWENCDFRTYRFVDSSDDDATMLETDESRQARGVAEQKIPSKEEQQNLYLQTMQTWEDRGFQNPLKLNEQFL